MNRHSNPETILREIALYDRLTRYTAGFLLFLSGGIVGAALEHFFHF
ncbi:MAG: hypothetical protein ABSA41_12465 [Terriglobia bacterium]|jgi:hypothetical protein